MYIPVHTLGTARTCVHVRCPHHSGRTDPLPAGLPTWTLASQRCARVLEWRGSAYGPPHSVRLWSYELDALAVGLLSPNSYAFSDSDGLYADPMNNYRTNQWMNIAKNRIDTNHMRLPLFVLSFRHYLTEGLRPVVCVGWHDTAASPIL